MNFIKFFKALKASLPIFNSVFKAYKQTTGGSKPDASLFSKYFSKVLGQKNLSAPQLTQTVALQILNIQKSGQQQIQAKVILQRYYVLFKKNDPQLGGTTYLQSKVYAAKQVLMQKFTDAAQLQQQFYKEVVQPQQKAQQQQRKKQEDQKKAESDKAAQNKQKQQNCILTQSSSKIFFEKIIKY